MQERASYAQRFHPIPSRNNQTWRYLDAGTVWDLAATNAAMQSAGFQGWG